MGRLEGKVALVTGAARGIGRGIALCLAEEGAHVVVIDMAPLPEITEVANQIQRLGQQSLPWQVDVANRNELEGVVRGAAQHFGGLDIVVANAACSVRQVVTEARWEDVRRVWDVSHAGVFSTCQFAAQQMVLQKRGGKIIIIGSIHAEVPFASSAAYNMAKAGVNQLARTMACELARHHINVNVINPGWIDTPGERNFRTSEELEQGGKRIPWGRLGTPRDIGRCAVFLASADSEYVTGASLRVDGGLMSGLTLPEESLNS